MRPLLHIIEPTLSNYSGHCYHHVSTLVGANEFFDVKVWMDKSGSGLFKGYDCEEISFFSRAFRKFQLGFCYASCLKKGGTIFIPTAGQLDMAWMDILMQLPVGPKKKNDVVFHFHQFKQTPAKLRRLRAWAKRNKRWRILATTKRLLKPFYEAGFENCEVAYYPVSKIPENTIYPVAASEPHLLYAGAAREDKGFGKVVNYLLYLDTLNLKWPASVQCAASGNKSDGELDSVCRDNLIRLKAQLPSFVDLKENTLATNEFCNQFQGAICLLLYDRAAYRDKFSAVALQAMQCGAPIITVRDTWMGDLVSFHGSGELVDGNEIGELHSAVKKVRSNYTDYRKRAIAAGEKLAAIHQPKSTLKLLSSGISR